MLIFMGIIVYFFSIIIYYSVERHDTAINIHNQQYRFMCHINIITQVEEGFIR